MNPDEQLSMVAIEHNGVVFALPFPREHRDLIREMKSHGLKVSDDAERGFVTTLGRYVVKENT